MDDVCRDVWLIDGNAIPTPAPQKPFTSDGKSMLTVWKLVASAVSCSNATALLDCTIDGKPKDVETRSALTADTQNDMAATAIKMAINAVLIISTLLYHGTIARTSIKPLAQRKANYRRTGPNKSGIIARKSW